MVTEIFVEGFQLDILADISGLLTFAIDDIRDFSSRSTAFSKTIVLPGTGNNNAIFGNIFETGIENDYNPANPNIGYNFNAAKSARCFIYQDNLQTFKGSLRLIEIDLTQGKIEYQVALNGELTALSVALASALITDLDFSPYDVDYTIPNIQVTWGTRKGSGVVFPHIDYGNYSMNKHDWDYHTFRPAIYVAEILKKIFDNAGFIVKCDLFKTDRFLNLIVPHNQKILQSSTAALEKARNNTKRLVVNGETSTGTSPFGPKIYKATAKWDTPSGGGFSYNASTGQYTYVATTGTNATIEWHLTGTQYLLKDNSFSFEDCSYYIRILKNGAKMAEKKFTPTKNGVEHYFYEDKVITSVNVNDVFEVQYEIQPGVATEQQVYLEGLGSDYSLFLVTANAAIPQPVALGGRIKINDTLPQNVRQVDFLIGIVKLFNLYVTESLFDERTIYIAPFIDFYDPMKIKTTDWSYKMNRNKAIKVQPMSELNSKIYQFNYKDDSDYYNTLYKNRYNQGYGSLIYDSEFEFTDATTKTEIIFAATPLVGYLGEDKVYSTIFSRTGEVTGVGEDQFDSVIRILQQKYIRGVEPWAITDGVNDGDAHHYKVLQNYDSYQYAGHLDDPDAPDNDLNFGALKELFFGLATGNLSKTQFNVYWSTYMGEITSKDSKLLTASFYLTPKDIFDLNFARFVIIDGTLFRLNKISNYNAIIPSDCTVELLRVINDSYTYVQFPPIFKDDFLLLQQGGDYVLDFDSKQIYYNGTG
jgi:hypothetical protein